METIGWLKKQLGEIEKEVQEWPNWKLGLEEENECQKKQSTKEAEVHNIKEPEQES